MTEPPAAAGGTFRRRSRLSELTDEELVQRAQSGNSRAFETLLRRHERAMFGTSLRLLSRSADAEDAVQEAFIASWRRLPEFRGDARFSTWLYRIVTNRSLNELRRRKPTADLDVEDAGPVPPGLVDTAGPERQAERSAMLEALQSALADLPEPLRVCWLLREVDHRSYDEIAEIVGVPEPTVRGRIARARTRLAEVMAPWR
ncbi:RNA polymerase sigma factor [Nakamurella sp.]|uniref:RNA polymerase sigma factor n=1 Tax=Nakamurella sp. TaxID=1869182 RepID=UPI0037848A75